MNLHNHIADLDKQIEELKAREEQYCKLIDMFTRCITLLSKSQFELAQKQIDEIVATIKLIGESVE